MSEFSVRVHQVLNSCLPAMTADGGGASIQIDEQSRVITLQLVGTCMFCPSQQQSAKALVQRMRNGLPDASLIRVLAPKRMPGEEYLAQG